MKKIIFIVFIGLLFVSCATTRTNITDDDKNIGVIYCYEEPDVKLAAIYGEPRKDGQMPLYEIEVRQVPEYYVLNKERSYATRYSINEKKELIKGKSIRVISIEGKISFAIPNKEKQKSDILINLDSKMELLGDIYDIPMYLGTWEGCTDTENKKKYTFKPDGKLIDENEKEEEFYLHSNKYSVIQDKVLVVEKWVKSLLSGKETVELECFYFDGKDLYELIFPIKDVSDNKAIQKSIRNSK